MASILNFNGKTFAHIRASAIGKCDGFFSRSQNGVSLYKPDRSLEAFVVNNSRQGYFVVSASNKSGKPFYMHGACELTTRWLALEGMTSEEKKEAISNMVFSENSCRFEEVEMA